MDIAASHVVEKAGPFFGQRLRVAFHKEHAFISERTWPVRVNLKLTSDVLRDHQFLRLSLVEEAHDEVALLIRDQQLVPLVRLQPKALESVILEEVEPLVGTVVAHHGL